MSAQVVKCPATGVVGPYLFHRKIHRKNVGLNFSPSLELDELLSGFENDLVPFFVQRLNI
jgi:hypothetical protein